MWEIEFTVEFERWWNSLDADEQESLAASVELLHQIRRTLGTTPEGEAHLMAKNFKELERKMRPESLARAKTRAKEMMAEMLLAEIRKNVGLTQEDLAAQLGIKQPTLSKLESQDDMQVSTLQRLVRALGGELELIAHLPGGDIRIRQFTGA